jgi:hypothetical protein
MLIVVETFAAVPTLARSSTPMPSAGSLRLGAGVAATAGRVGDILGRTEPGAAGGPRRGPVSSCSHV